ncbi:hypothetical protein QM007_05200 [Rothia sp. SD9660Na]|uniref:hypothetical protein n=1 Tax=Rothia sp. SD9660Na TaxID=3047030 RepID=UPI0024BB9433|nr:hypothetical protein [Rothia sp. SD9660Na]WHS51357.1 hypothetical protein QM007_05200 [Rothia sp. SD9660Na]
MSELLDFLTRGQAENLVNHLQSVEPEERMQVLAPLKPLAQVVLRGAPGEMSQQWYGPLTEEHRHAADVVVFPDVDSLLRQVPLSHRFIRESIPELFPGALAQVFEAWSGLYVKAPKNYDRRAAILRAAEWFDGRYDVSLPASREAGFVFFTGRFHLGWVYDVLVQNPLECRHMVRAVFLGPSAKGLSLRQADEIRLPIHTVREFLLPALCQAEILDRTEVRNWCEIALASKEHSAFEKVWFRQVLDAQTE